MTATAFPRFPSPVALAAALNSRAACDKGALPPLQVAWALRQADPPRAASIARTMLARPQGGEEADRFAAGYYTLVLAESASLAGDLDHAEMLLADAAQHFAACPVVGEQGLADAEYLAAPIWSDRGDFTQRRACMQRAKRHAVATQDTERANSAALALYCFDAFEDPRLAWDVHAADVQDLSASGGPGIQALAYSFMAYCLFDRAGDGGVGARSDFAQACQYGLVASRLARDSGQIRRAIMEAAFVACCLLDYEDVEGCMDVLTPVLDEARRLGWPQSFGRCLSVCANAFQRLGRRDAALAAAVEAAQVLAVHPWSKNYLLAQHAVGSMAVDAKDWDTAEAAFVSLRDAPGTGERSELGRHGILGLAHVACGRGSLDAASELAGQVRQLAEAAGDIGAQVDALRLGAKVAALEGTQEGAAAGPSGAGRLALLRQAARLAQEHMGPQNSVAALGDLATALAEAGHWQEAAAAFESVARSHQVATAAGTARKAVAVEVRLQTDRALAEAELQRQAAVAEAARVAELETLNEQLRAAMTELRTTQDLLMQRNSELTAAYGQIQELSLTDTLTGLRNRRYLSQVIEGEVAACLRSYRPSGFTPLDDQHTTAGFDLVFYLLDLDHFKAVNDTYGHSAGDALLSQFATRLRGVTRPQDHVVRWGGEEFLVAARALRREDAHVMAERIRAAIADAPFLLPNGSELRKTCSVGYAAFPLTRGRDDHSSWMDAVDLADARLYQAKQEGRNRCIGQGQPVKPG